MAVNRYDNPAQAQFINTYVPIPFEQLYTLGKEAKAEVDKAYNAYTSALDKWGEFKSPSEVDTKAFYGETYGRALPIAEEMARNIDLIKTPEGRAKIFSAINNVDRAKLSMLKQSADNLRARQEINAKLMMEGKYNPLWHDVDFTNYNTQSSGIYNDLAPLAYKDIRELSDPYYSKLQKGYLYTKGGYDYFGNTMEDLEGVANAHLNDIANTPEAKMHMQKYMESTGANAQQALEWLRQSVIDSNIDRTIRPTREVNPYSLLAAKTQAAKKAKEQEVSSQSRVKELQAALALRRYNKLGDEQKKIFDETGNVENDLNSLYHSLYNRALNSSDKNAVKKLIESQTERWSPSEFEKYISTIGDVEKVDLREENGPTKNRMYLNNFNNVVPMNDDGVPVLEISRATLANNEQDLVKLFDKWYKLDAFADPNKKAEDLINSYGEIIYDLTSRLTEGYFVPGGKLQDYSKDGNNFALATGKLAVPAKVVEDILEANIDKYGELSVSDIEEILFEKGISGKHKIGKKVKLKEGEKGESQDYYEINLGIPVFDDPSATKAFDDVYTKEAFSGSSSFDAERSHANISFNSNM